MEKTISIAANPNLNHNNQLYVFERHVRSLSLNYGCRKNQITKIGTKPTLEFCALSKIFQRSPTFFDYLV